MGIDRINPDTVYTPEGNTYSQVVKASGNTHVHVSGMVGLTPDGELVGEDMYEQTVQVLENLSRALDAAGADVADVVRVRILTTDAEEFITQCIEPAVEWFGEHKPASTLHEVAGLALPMFKVEIEATAILND